MKILFIDSVHPFLKEALIADGHECIEGYKLSRDEIRNQINNYHGVVIRSRILLDEDILSKSNLLFIARAGAGMESIDIIYARSKNIICLNSPEGNRDAVGEHAIAMFLSLINNLKRSDEQVRKGIWSREENRGYEIKGKTVGIIGFGNMGSTFAQKFRGFDCKILAYDKYKSGFGDKYVKEVLIDELFDSTDILSLHVPLTEETEYLIDNTFINKFKKNIYLINTARGKCVNTDDLVANLKNGKIKGACLDVIEYEDSSFEKISKADFTNHPSWKYLVNSDKVIFTPHIAGWSFESNERIARVLYEKIKQFIAEPLI
jgi:D-3-phosphoglycerate dehydrogenase